MFKIIFDTPVQAALYNEELAGQVSDGMWENSRPYGHWRYMSSAEGVVMPGVAPGPFGFRPKRKYNFNHSLLVEVVGDRMLQIAQKVAGPDYTLKDLRKDLKRMSQIVNGNV
jgi:hypothetical protein